MIYTNPEIAVVGETEESASAKGINFKKIKTPMQYSGKYVIENENADGIIKIISNSDNKKIIGIHMIGNGSSEIIYGAGMMVKQGMKIDDAKSIIFPHPTVSEIIGEAISKIL